MPNERFHVGGWFAFGRLSSLRGTPLFVRSSSEVRSTGGFAGPRQTTHWRPPHWHPYPQPQTAPTQ